MNIEDLGRRTVKCRHWRWLRGMKTLESGAAARAMAEDMQK